MRYRQPELYSKSAVSSGTFNILCLGDSFTYGMGVSFEYSYPRQLENMLNNEGGIEKKVNVENLGSPGGNSYRILKIFSENIHRHKPDLAIVMVGGNNDWNLEGIQRFYQGSFLKKMKLDIYDLRIYKLWEILTMSLKKKMAKVPYGKRFLSSESKNEQTVISNQAHNEAITSDKEKSINANQQVQIDPSEWENHRKNLEFYRKSTRSDLAIQEINNMLKKYPGAYQLQGELVLFLREMGNYDLALERAKKVLESYSDDLQTNAYMHMELVYIYRAKKDWRAARREMDYAIYDFSFIESIFPELKAICDKESGLDFDKEAESLRKQIGTIYVEKGTEIWDRLLYLKRNQKAKFKILEADLLELINIARKNRVKLILMTYPMCPKFNDAIRSVALKYNIGLVDNELIFKEKPNNDELFVSDGHCNKKGYEVVAVNICSTLFKTGILSKNTMGQKK